MEKQDEGTVNTSTEFVLLPDDTGKEVKVPKSAVENLDWDLTERGAVKKEKISELAKRGMRQDEFSRKLNELQKEREELEQLREVLASAEANKGKGDETDKGHPAGSDSEELSELSFKDDDIVESNPEIIKQLVKRYNAQSKYIKNLENNLKADKTQREEQAKKQSEQLQEQQRFAEEVRPVVQKHKWLVKDDQSFDEAKSALFAQRLRVDTDKSVLEIADWVDEHFKGRSQKSIDDYLKEKEEQQKKPSFTPRTGTGLPLEEVKLEGKTLSEQIEEAGQKYKT